MIRSILIFLSLLLFSQIIKGQNLEQKLSEIATSNEMMGGAAILFCESGIIDMFYFGKSDYKRNIDIHQNTKFRIASISKTITAIAIMQLVEKDLLKLETDITDILGYEVQNPHYLNQAITIEMLLAHTSTIVDGSTYGQFLRATVNENPIPDLREILRAGGRFYDTTQFYNALPGAYFYYSNLNYVILGTIVEKVSNLRFDVYCRQNIFQPLGLDASFNVNDLKNIDDLAVLYRKNKEIWTPQADNYEGKRPEPANLQSYVPGTNGGRFGPQGSLRCSAKDLVEIFTCLFNQNTCNSSILSHESVANMIDDHWTYKEDNGNNYHGLFRSWGLGIHRITSTPNKDVVLSDSRSMFGHPGEAYGLISDIYYDIDQSIGVVFITNGVGVGYKTNDKSAFYTIEKAFFEAIEKYGDLGNCPNRK